MSKRIECPACNQTVFPKALSCHGCGFPVAHLTYEGPGHEANALFTDPNYIESWKQNKVISGELVVLAIFAWIIADSWWAFVIAAIAGLFCLITPVLAFIVGVLLTICWGLIGYSIGSSYFDGIIIPIVLAGLGLAIRAIVLKTELKSHQDNG